MALRAYIQSIEFPNDVEAQIVAVVTDDVRKQEVFIRTASISQLKDSLRNVLQDVEGVESLKALNVNDVIDLSNGDPVIPIGAAFFTAWRQLQSELAKVDAGIIDANDARVTNALKAAQGLDDSTFLVGRS